MATAALEMIIFALCTAISALHLSSFLQSGPAAAGAPAQRLDATLQVLLTAAPTVAFFVAVTLLYAHLIRAGGDRPISEAITFTLCAAVGVLELFLLVLSGGMDGALAPPLDAAVQMLLPAATVTFFLAMALAYVHLRTGAGNEPIPEAVERLTKMTLGAAVVTAMLSLMVVILTFGSERIA